VSHGLEGRTALVTGGTSGIGRAVVERLRREGMAVAFIGRDALRGAEVAAATGAAFIAADARDRAACDRSVDEALAHLGGRLELFVANAAVVFRGSIEETPEPVFRELLEVNLTATFRYSRACFRVMREQGGGALVHVASDAAMRGIHTIAAYSVTKAAVLGVSELLAADGAAHGVRSNAICPGAVVPGVQSTVAGYEHHAEDASGWSAPVSARHGSGEDVANMVAWMASDEAAHLSGATVRLDGSGAAAMRGPARA
jgi:NAD(P)-dependent dehydrogenase (short-subunit alcohol dehydrogenase family)